MDRTGLRAAVESHPALPLARSSDRAKVYDAREIALWIIDHPNESQYRLSDWWHAPLRNADSFIGRHLPEAVGKPTCFLGFEIELAAYRLIASVAAGEHYAPDDIDLVARGGSRV